MEINISDQLALKTENRTLNRFLVQTYLTGIVMLDDHSQEMRCFQNKSINLFLLQKRKVINAYSQVLILTCHIGETQKKELIKKKHTVRAGQDFPPLTVLVLEYQCNTGSQNCSFWSTKFKADILYVLRKLSGTDFLPCVVG